MSKIPNNSELLDPLLEMYRRQDENDFSLEGIPEFFIAMYQKKRWLTKFGVITAEGIKKIEKFNQSY